MKNPVADMVCQTFWYLATPYRSHPAGRPWAHDDACQVAAFLMGEGVKVFCPIVHGHILTYFGLDPTDHEFWMKMDRPFMDAASGIIVAQLPGWEDSVGIAEEIDRFKDMNKHVVYMSC